MDDEDLILDDIVEITSGTQMSEGNKDAEAEGFDMSTATEWIYPTNYPVRDYQRNIVKKALFENTLVSLPTGLGKTFIAAVVMYNYHRWFPRHKVVFMAHSKPLVAQQVQACCDIMGISQKVTAELNGTISLKQRKLQWEKKRIFFLTPQVFNNDLSRGLVAPDNIRCLVVDEAHKALGNQAYCQAIRSLQPFNSNFRVLALSATPGDDMNFVKAVVENLLISHLELRNEEDSDIRKYLHGRKVDVIVVNLDAKIIEYRDQLLSVADKYLRPLVQAKAVGCSFGSLSSFGLYQKQRQFLANPNVGSDQRGLVLSNFSVAISLLKASEELITHGLRSFLNKLLNIQSGEGSTNNVHHRLSKDDDFKTLIAAVEDYIGKDRDVAFDPDVSMARIQDERDAIVESTPPPLVYSHPKFVVLQELITSHFEKWSEKEESTKVIVFCKRQQRQLREYGRKKNLRNFEKLSVLGWSQDKNKKLAMSRPCTGEICNFLSRFRPLVKPMILIGQSNASTGSTTKGLKQSAQLEVMRKFRSGIYNTLVATCVGEEGLDVGEVDLIINFDASKNSNTQVQRAGRTGRKREGRVVSIVTEGKEYQDYNISLSKSKTMKKRLTKEVNSLPLYSNSPRLIPKNVNPVCQEMFLKPPSDGITPDKASKTTEKIASSKKPTKKRKKESAEDISSSQSIKKYDIRFALSQAQKKKKLVETHSDSSDSLFDNVGAVDRFKENERNQKISKARKLKAKESCEHGEMNYKKNEAQPIEVVDIEDCLETTPNERIDEYPDVQLLDGGNCKDQNFKLTNNNKFLLSFKLPVDDSVCDLLDTLSVDELKVLANEKLMSLRIVVASRGQYTATKGCPWQSDLPSDDHSEDLAHNESDQKRSSLLPMSRSDFLSFSSLLIRSTKNQNSADFCDSDDAWGSRPTANGITFHFENSLEGSINNGAELLHNGGLVCDIKSKLPCEKPASNINQRLDISHSSHTIAGDCSLNKHFSSANVKASSTPISMLLKKDKAVNSNSAAHLFEKNSKGLVISQCSKNALYPPCDKPAPVCDIMPMHSSQSHLDSLQRDNLQCDTLAFRFDEPIVVEEITSMKSESCIGNQRKSLSLSDVAKKQCITPKKDASMLTVTQALSLVASYKATHNEPINTGTEKVNKEGSLNISEIPGCSLQKTSNWFASDFEEAMHTKKVNQSNQEQDGSSSPIFELPKKKQVSHLPPEISFEIDNINFSQLSLRLAERKEEVLDLESPVFSITPQYINRSSSRITEQGVTEKSPVLKLSQRFGSSALCTAKSINNDAQEDFFIPSQRKLSESDYPEILKCSFGHSTNRNKTPSELQDNQTTRAFSAPLGCTQRNCTSMDNEDNQKSPVLQVSQNLQRSMLRSLAIPTSNENKTLEDKASQRILFKMNESKTENTLGEVCSARKSLSFGQKIQGPHLAKVNYLSDSDDDLFFEAEKELKRLQTQQIKDDVPDDVQVNSDGSQTQLYDLDNFSPPPKPVQDGEPKVKQIRGSPSFLFKDATSLLSPLKDSEPLFCERAFVDCSGRKVAVVRPMTAENVETSDSGWASTVNKPRSPSLLSVMRAKRRNTALCKAAPKPLHPSSSSFRLNDSLSEGNKHSPSLKAKPSTSRIQETVASFDCIPDDLVDFLTCSPVSEIKHSTPLNKRGDFNTSSVMISTVQKSASSAPKVLSDEELSDGALEALKLVDEFERKTKPAETSVNSTSSNFGGRNDVNFNVWGSDDSDDLFEERDISCQRQRSKRKDNGLKKKKHRHHRRKSSNPFIEAEAELTDDGETVSSDEKSSGLDEMDSSFLDERFAPTQAPDVDMTARYLSTVKSVKVVPGGFKIPEAVSHNFPVCSQVDHYEEDYEKDSFCVDDFLEEDREDMSALELAELILEKRKKRRRTDTPTSKPISTKKKRRRIVIMDSSSDEEKGPKSKTDLSSRPSEGNITSNLTITASSINKEKKVLIASTGIAAGPSIQSSTPLVFIGSMQIASTPEITTALRAKWKFRVEVRSSPGADYTVGWRMGINRIALSDFCNGSPITKAHLKDSVIKLLELFSKPILIVEDDKNKAAPRTVGCHRDLWAKHSAKRLARLHHAGVRTIFTKGREETAKVIAILTQMECVKGFGVPTEWKTFSPNLESRLSFYCSLPGINLANALRLCRKFSTLSTFLSVCDSVSSLQKEMEVPHPTAVNIFLALQRPPSS